MSNFRRYVRLKKIVETTFKSIEEMYLGYHWLYVNTNKYQRTKLRKRIEESVKEVVFPEEIVDRLVNVALDERGLVRDETVYNWLVDLAFKGNKTNLYLKWQRVKDGNSSSAEKKN